MSERPPLKRRHFLSAVVGTSLTLLAGCSSDDASNSSSPAADESGTSNDDQQTAADDATTSTETASETEENNATEQTSQSTTAALGEVVDGGEMSMVARDFSTTESLDEFQEADEGNQFVVVRLAVKNTSADFVDFSSFWQTQLKDAENVVYDASFGVTGNPFDSGSLAPGEVSRGDVVYEVPTDAEGLTMRFDLSSFDFFEYNQVTIDLGNEASSSGDLSQDLGVEVNDPGAAADRNGVSVTVHGVRTTASLGEYSEADEGMEYVIPDIEVTNDTGEALTVSTLLQMRIKTGTGLSYQSDLMGSSALDKAYSEGSDIQAGQSRRGELAFQVEQGTSPLYFVFDFLDLADSYKAFWSLR